MKTLKQLTLFMAAICLALSFSDCKRQKAPEMVTETFEAKAIGNYIYVGPDTLPNPKCTGQLSLWRAIVDGKGSGTPIGDFTVHFDFCGDSLSNYGNCDAYLVAADGDSLFIDASGRVMDGRLDEHPAFVTSYWRDTINILGGTGKFRGATGEFITDDYNSSEDPNSHHHWTGTITMAKEKK
jgi:hypothetical protein